MGSGNADHPGVRGATVRLLPAAALLEPASPRRVIQSAGGRDTNGGREAGAPELTKRRISVCMRWARVTDQGLDPMSVNFGVREHAAAFAEGACSRLLSNRLLVAEPGRVRRQ